MPVSDELKKLRGQNYGDKSGAPDGKDPDPSNSTPRIIKLSDDEQKSFDGSQPGQELACEVRGNLEEDGHFHVMSVKPLGGGNSYSENEMAKQVAGRIAPAAIA